MTASGSGTAPAQPTDPASVARWRRYLANERAEARVYRELAARHSGEDQAILLGLAEAEGRHEAHWLELLRGQEGRLPRADLRTRMLSACARRFGMVFVLALAQRAEGCSPYDTDPDATAAMAADERIHGEVVRALAAQGRRRIAGSLRAAVFGLNDGLVSNLALVLGMAATGVSTQVVLVTGLAGLLAGACSMAVGEYISVRSQRELLASAHTDEHADDVIGDLDLQANELALVYRARGLDADTADIRAARVIRRLRATSDNPAAEGYSRGRVPLSTGPTGAVTGTDDAVVGSAIGAAGTSFAAFAIGAAFPVLPFIAGLSGMAGLATAVGVVGVILLLTGMLIGLFSGGSTVRTALRQITIGYAAAAVTYLLGLLCGAVLR